MHQNCIPTSSFHNNDIYFNFLGVDGKGDMGEVLMSFWLMQKKERDQALTSPKDINPHLRYKSYTKRDKERAVNGKKNCFTR